MTVTIKLEAPLEERLRQRAAATGRSTSDVIRAALRAYLDQPEQASMRSAFELGAATLRRHRGAADLAAARREALAELRAAKHRWPGR